MASSSSSSKLVLFPCLFLTCFFLFTFSNNLVVAEESDKVNLNLYYESLCPSCQSFIVNDLVKVYDSDLYTITNLTLIPFGNAHVSDNLTVTCQHGEEECELNALEACIIKAIPDPKLHYKYIRCIENDTKSWGSSCFKGYGGDEEAIIDCYFSELSNKLILENAKQTMSLKPPHQYVPWLTLNGKPLYENLNDFVAQVCRAYKGKAPLPKICSSSDSSERKVSKLEVSYANEATNY